MSIIISDTTPLNYLILIDRIDVLRALYGRVIIPEAVGKELLRDKTPQKVRDWMLSRPDWLETGKLAAPPDESLEYLDEGEREAITLAKELKALAIVIDDEEGRAEAKRQGLLVIGTLRVLYDASEKGFCELKETFDQLRATSFHASEKLYQDLLDLKGPQ